VPRPECIARLHAAKYDLRSCDGADKAKLLAEYQKLLAEVAREYGLTSIEVEAAVRKAFGVWVRQKRLPKLPEAGAHGTVQI